MPSHRYGAPADCPRAAGCCCYPAPPAQSLFASPRPGSMVQYLPPSAVRFGGSACFAPLGWPYFRACKQGIERERESLLIGNRNSSTKAYQSTFVICLLQNRKMLLCYIIIMLHVVQIRNLITRVLLQHIQLWFHCCRAPNVR